MQTSVAKNSLYRVYNDGSHYVAIKSGETNSTRNYDSKLRLKDMLFENLYTEVLLNGYKKDRIYTYIRDTFHSAFGYIEDNEFYIKKKLIQKAENMKARFQRFERKVNLHKWSYFTTFTYDDKKCTEIEFKKKLRKCLSNLHTRNGWKYIGVWERGETGRLHFHCLLFVPLGEMIGTISEVKEYNPQTKQMETKQRNSFFYKKFGRNDFSDICPVQLASGQTVNYLLKYVVKSTERLIFSRALPDVIYVELDEEKDISSKYEVEIKKLKRFVIKCVISDDIIDSEEVINSPYQFINTV